MYAIHRGGNKQHNLKFFGEQQAHERKLKNYLKKNKRKAMKTYKRVRGNVYIIYNKSEQN